MCVCVRYSLCQEIEIRVCSCLFEVWGPLMELTDGKSDAFHFHFPLQEDQNHIKISQRCLVKIAMGEVIREHYNSPTS